MKIGYNTNGLAHHRFMDAITLMADYGYEAIAITPDVSWLDPYQDAGQLARQVADTARLLDRFGMQCVVESGARYLLNPRLKHAPTLMDVNPEERALRLDYLKRLIQMAADLNATCFSFWSGKLFENLPRDQADQRLADGIIELLPMAEKLRIPLAFEPEPGMYIQTMDDFRRIDALIQNGWFHLTIDLGHLHCMGEEPIPDIIREWNARILNIHIEDMRPGIHEHLMFGDGTMRFPPIFQALRDINYSHSVNVELSRDSHRVVEIIGICASLLNSWRRD